MLRERKRTHRVPELNTTSTADISFMLLTFFLVTTSMDSDNGMSRQLPPMPQQKEQTVQEVKRRNVLIIGIGADNGITCNGKPVEMDALRGRVAEFVDNAGNLAREVVARYSTARTLFGYSQSSDFHSGRQGRHLRCLHGCSECNNGGLQRFA